MLRSMLYRLGSCSRRLIGMALRSEYGNSPGEVESRFLKAAHLAFAAHARGIPAADLDVDSSDSWRTMTAHELRRDVEAAVGLPRRPSALTWDVARRLLLIGERYSRSRVVAQAGRR